MTKEDLAQKLDHIDPGATLAIPEDVLALMFGEVTLSYESQETAAHSRSMNTKGQFPASRRMMFSDDQQPKDRLLPPQQNCAQRGKHEAQGKGTSVGRNFFGL